MRALATAATLALAACGATAAHAQEAPVAPAASPAEAPSQETPPSALPGATAGEPAAVAEAAADAELNAPLQRDPLEGFNRAMWGLNMGVDKVVLKPVSSVYRTITPRPVRRGLSRVLANLTEPWSFINGMLQGKPKRAFNSLGRFVVNSTFGVAGLGDPATKMGMPATPEDFGQTLASWGVKSSVYLVLPILGPSTIRDGIGTGTAFFADPYRIGLRESGLSTWEQRGVNAFEVVSARSDLTDSGGDTFLATSLDSYATARSAYLQRRQAAILDQDGDGLPAAAAGASGSDDAALDAALAEIQAEQGEAGAPASDPAAELPPPGADLPAPDSTVPPPEPNDTPLPPQN